MSKFHINPKTGNTGICKARQDKCPFAGDDEHFATREEAQKHYEQKEAGFYDFVKDSKMPPTRGAYTIAIFDPSKAGAPIDKSDGNTLDKFYEKMGEAEDKTRLVLESGQVWERNILQGPDAWKFVSGDEDHRSGLERRKTYSYIYLQHAINSNGARLENGGGTPRMSPEHRTAIMPDSEEIGYESRVIGSVFNKNDGGGDAQDLNEHLDDYITERWSGLTPHQWPIIRKKLIGELGEPHNLGTDNEPSWIWKKPKLESK